MILTLRDQAIIRSLTRRVRIVTLGLIRAHWWSSASTHSTARRRMAQLVDAGWLGCRCVPSRPLLILSQPVFAWNPGAVAPNFDAISWALQRRWSNAARRQNIFFATRQATECFGGSARGSIKNLSQVTHDLHVSLLYFNLLRHEPELAACWVGEDELAHERRHAKLPDAILRDSHGHVLRVIEFGGAYSARRVRAFHQDCARRGHSYEIY